VKEFVVHLDPAYQDAKADRTARLRRIGGIALMVIGVLMFVGSVYAAIYTIDQAKAIYAWIISAGLGLFAIWIGWGQLRSIAELVRSDTRVEVFTVLPQGISIPFPGQRVPVLERGWGKFSLTLGTALGKPVLHFLSDDGPKGDFQLTQMDKSAAEIDAALRTFSKGRQGVEGMPTAG
jgi:hypothetical protein